MKVVVNVNGQHQWKEVTGARVVAVSGGASRWQTVTRALIAVISGGARRWKEVIFGNKIVKLYVEDILYTSAKFRWSAPIFYGSFRLSITPTETGFPRNTLTYEYISNDLTPNTEYTATIIAYENVNWTGITASDTVTFTTLDAFAPIQITFPTVSGTGFAFSSISGSSGTYETGSYISKTVAIRYTTSSIQPDDGLNTTITLAGSPPYNITQNDATFPKKYFYYVDQVKGNDNKTYYYYSQSNVSSKVGQLSDDFNRSNSSGTLGYMTPIWNSQMNPNSYMYNISQNGSFWSVSGSRAVNLTNAYSVQAVEMGGDVSGTTQVLFGPSSAGQGVSFWVSASGSWYGAVILPEENGTIIKYTYRTTTMEDRYSWTSKRNATVYKYYKNYVASGYNVKYGAGGTQTRYRVYTPSSNCNGPARNASGPNDASCKNCTITGTNSTATICPSSDVSKRLGPVYTTTGQECATQQTTCSTCTGGPFTSITRPTSYCGSLTTNYDTTCTKGPYTSTNANAQPTYCSRTSSTTYSCPSGYSRFTQGGQQYCQNNSTPFNIIGATATTTYTFYLYENTVRDYTYKTTESSTCYYYWYNETGTVTTYTCPQQSPCDVENIFTSSPPFNPLYCSNTTTFTYDLCDGPLEFAEGTLITAGKCFWTPATKTICGGTLYSTEIFSSITDNCSTPYSQIEVKCDVPKNNQTFAGATCPPDYGYAYLQNGQFYCQNQYTPFNIVAATIVDSTICDSVYYSQVDTCQGGPFEVFDISNIPLICSYTTETSPAYTYYMKVLRSSGGSVFTVASTSLGITTNGVVDPVQGIRVYTDLSQSTNIVATALMNSGNVYITTNGTPPGGRSGAGLLKAPSVLSGSYYDELSIEH
jgi:hypothetical protein